MRTVSLSEIEQAHLKSAFQKIHQLSGREIRLYRHEADALYKEFCRLANFATLLGEPSPAEMAGIYTAEEAKAMAEAFLRGDDVEATE